MKQTYKQVQENDLYKEIIKFEGVADQKQLNTLQSSISESHSKIDELQSRINRINLNWIFLA